MSNGTTYSARAARNTTPAFDLSTMQEMTDEQAQDVTEQVMYRNALSKALNNFTGRGFYIEGDYKRVRQAVSQFNASNDKRYLVREVQDQPGRLAIVRDMRSREDAAQDSGE